VKAIVFWIRPNVSLDAPAVTEPKRLSPATELAALRGVIDTMAVFQIP
jgi:hypothetical protein